MNFNYGFSKSIFDFYIKKKHLKIVFLKPYFPRRNLWQNCVLGMNKIHLRNLKHRMLMLEKWSERDIHKHLPEIRNNFSISNTALRYLKYFFQDICLQPLAYPSLPNQAYIRYKKISLIIITLKVFEIFNKLALEFIHILNKCVVHRPGCSSSYSLLYYIYEMMLVYILHYKSHTHAQ